MTAVDVDALDAARAAATRGPWGLDAKGWIDAGDYDTVIGPADVDCMSYCYGGTSRIEGDNLHADAALIVAAVNALPDLLAEVRRGRALRDDVRELCDSAADGYVPVTWLRDLLAAADGRWAVVRPAGSPGTCGALYRAQPTGGIGTPAKPPDAPGGLPAGARALPVPRTEPPVTTEDVTL